MKITYKLKKGAEGEELVVVKRGHEVEFKMSDVKAHVEKMKTLRKELEAQVELERAKQQNVEDHHPIVGGMTDEEMAAVSIYYASKGIQKKSEEKLQDVVKLLMEYGDELLEINAQTGLTL